MRKLTTKRPALRRVNVQPSKRARSFNDPRSLYYQIKGDDYLTLLDPVVDPDQVQELLPPYQKTFEYAGDNLYVDVAEGDYGVRLGARGNPIIPVRPGMRLQRPFNRVTVYFRQQPGLGSLQLARVSTLWPSAFSMYVSTGPLVLDAGNRLYGFGPRSVGATDNVANTTADYLTFAYQSPADLQPHHPGRDGSILMLRNMDPANTLFLVGMQDSLNPGIYEELWRLLPG